MRQQVRQIAQPHRAREAREYVGEVLGRVEVDDPAATEDRECDRGTLTEVVVAGEEEVLSVMRSST
jgi:hypothetical protein